MDVVSKVRWNIFKRIDNKTRFRLCCCLLRVCVALYGVRLICCKVESLLVVHGQNFDCGDQIFNPYFKKRVKYIIGP
jgi:hypothetical protein